MRCVVTLVLSTALVAAGCAAPAESPEPPVDLDAERAALMEADSAWFAAYSNADIPADAFVERVAEDAILLAPDAPMARGREAIHGVVSTLEAVPGFDIVWSPTVAAVGSGGDLGYTIGTYQMSMQSPDGEPVQVEGKYLTVWRKQTDGSWMVVADMFNADGPPSPVE